MDAKLRALKRAAVGCPDARDVYIKELERLAGVSHEEEEKVYVGNSTETFKFDVEGVIYNKGPERSEIAIYLPTIGSHLGFMLHGFPEQYWTWLLDCLKMQISDVAKKAYQAGVRDNQRDLRKVMGIH